MRATSRRGELTRVSVGLDSFVLGYRDPTDYTQGFRHVIDAGARFTVVNHAQGKRSGRGFQWRKLLDG